jgi:rhodanese-related sulfurtransferase
MTIQGPYVLKNRLPRSEKGRIMRPIRLCFLMIAVGLMLAVIWSCGSAQKAPQVDKETLKSWLGNADLVILDVRLPEHWQGSGTKINGALREDPKEVNTWVATLPKDKKIVLYCAKGLTSARLAQQLQKMGFPQVWALKGGFIEWEKAGYPTETK